MSLRLRIPEPKRCEECGGEAVPHKITYTTLAIDELTQPLILPLLGIHQVLDRHIRRVNGKLAPYLADATIRLGLAEYVDAPDDKTMLLAKVLWEEGAARNIRIQEYRLFGLPRNMFVAQLPNGTRLGYSGIPYPSSMEGHQWWLDNKAELKKRFSKIGFPVAKGAAVYSEKEAIDLFRELEAPVIVKPYSGSGSRHTTLHINNEKELIRAFHVAKQVAPYALVEEELYGSVYRPTVVHGKLEAVLRRDPPSVVGDGIHTIRELVAEENQLPARQGPYFSHIQIDSPKAEAELAWQNLTKESVPEKGRRVMFHQKINWGVGGGTEDVTDEVHPDNKALFEEVSRVLTAPIVGIDFIIEDIGRSWKEQKRCGIIECNSMPFFDNHHLPMRGKLRNVAGAIWDMNLA